MPTISATTPPTAVAHPSTAQRLVWLATGVVLTLVASLLVSQAWLASAAPGDDDTTFVPIANCRLMDTRPGELPAGGRKTPIGQEETHTQQVTGAVGDCTIPAEAVAVSMNVTIANPTAQSNLRVFPGDVVAVPTVSNLNWLAGQSPTPNKVDVKLSPTGQMKVYNFRGAVDVIVDVVGYSINTSLRELDASMPFAVSDNQDPLLGTLLEPTPEAVATVTVTAPVDGQVTLNSRAEVQQTDAGKEVRCSIETTPTTITDSERQRFEGTGPTIGNLAGTRTFDIAAGATVDFHLVCAEDGVGGVAFSRTLTGIFTPAP